MRILVNATTIVVGGGIQNIVSLLNEALRDSPFHEWRLALSDRVASELRQAHPLAADQVHVFTSTPALDRAARRRLQALDADLRPDCVFMYNGPAYVKFRAPPSAGLRGALGHARHMAGLSDHAISQSMDRERHCIAVQSALVPICRRLGDGNRCL
jgi:hypothetical protein